MGQAKIRHIAICTKDTRKLADFYINTFGMTQVMEQTPNAGRPATDQRAIYVSDGYINLAILPARDNPEGINHFGFQVDDPAAVVEAAGTTAESNTFGAVAESWIHDPEGNRIDITKHGWPI